VSACREDPFDGDVRELNAHKGDGSCYSWISNSLITTCWLLGALGMFSLAFPSHVVTRVEVLSRGSRLGPDCPYTELPVGWDECCVPVYPP